MTLAEKPTSILQQWRKGILSEAAIKEDSIIGNPILKYS